MNVAAARQDSVQLGVQGLTIEGAIDHLVDAAQAVVENQLELGRLEVELTVGRVLSSGAYVLVGAVLIGIATVTLAMAAYELFPQYPPTQRLAILAAASGAIGAGLTAIGLRRMRAHGGE